MVEKFAEDWRDELLYDKSNEVGWRQKPLAKFICSYMNHRFEGVLDAFMGIKHDSFDGIRLVFRSEQDREKYGPNVVELVCDKTIKKLQRRFEALLEVKELTLTDRELKQLRAEYRKKVLYELHAALDGLAEERAKVIAEGVLDALMMKDEWVLLVEDKMARKRVQEDDD